MTDQLELALADRHEGQDANLAAGDTDECDDRNRVEDALGYLARSGVVFGADDVHKRIKEASDRPYKPNMVSSVMGFWAQDGRICRIEGTHAISERRSRHASRNGLWCGPRDDSDDVPSPR